MNWHPDRQLMRGLPSEVRHFNLPQGLYTPQEGDGGQENVYIVASEPADNMKIYALPIPVLYHSVKLKNEVLE